MEFPTEIIGDKGVITVNSDLDTEAAGDALQAALEQILECGKKSIVINLSQVQIVNSYGLGKLFGCYKKMKDNQGELRVKSPQGFVKDMMGLLLIDQLMPVEE
jgi:anti-anti-sigma factor